MSSPGHIITYLHYRLEKALVLMENQHHSKDYNV